VLKLYRLAKFCQCALLLLLTSTTYASVDKTITSWMAKNQIPGAAVLIYDHGKPHSYYFGYAEKKHKIPVNKNTIFEIASFTKIFTSILLAEEINARKMHLDDSIEKYLPNLLNDKMKDITLIDLATHTSGFALNVPNELRTNDELKNYFDQWRPEFTVGTKWQYSNINFGLIGFALEKVTNKPIAQLYQAQLFSPLGMKDIGLEVKNLKNYAQGYSDDKAVPHSRVGFFPAAAALKATGADMLIFLKTTLALPGTPTNIIDAVHLTETPFVSTSEFNQGMGWVIYPEPYKNKDKLLNPSDKMVELTAKPIDKDQQKFDGNSLMDKTGTAKGFRAYIAIIPNKKSGIIILTNRYVQNSKIIKVAREILFTL